MLLFFIYEMHMMLLLKISILYINASVVSRYGEKNLDSTELTEAKQVLALVYVWDSLRILCVLSQLGHGYYIDEFSLCWLGSRNEQRKWWESVFFTDVITLGHINVLLIGEKKSEPV